MRRETESGILKQARDYFRLKGWFVIRIQQGLGCMKGLSDLIAVRNGKTLFIEIKTMKGRQSDHQKEFEREITAAGGIYLVIRSLQGLGNELKRLEERK